MPKLIEFCSDAEKWSIIGFSTFLGWVVVFKL